MSEIAGRLARAAKGLWSALCDKQYRRAIEARTLTRALSHLNPNVQYLGISDGDGVTFVHVADSVITPYIVATGEFQRKDFETAWRECERLLPRPAAGVFVDVGANVGTTTLYAMRTGRFARALCLEPAPDNLRVLRLNVLANGLTDRVGIFPVACDAGAGTANLWLSSANRGDHRVAGAAAPTAAHEASVPVKTMPLDAVLRAAASEASSVSLVWVDTQGHEPGVLAGAAEVLAAGVPFCIEFWPAEYQRRGTLDGIVVLIASSFGTFVDLRDASLKRRHVSELPALTTRLLASSSDATAQTDILLFPAAGG